MTEQEMLVAEQKARKAILDKARRDGKKGNFNPSPEGGEEYLNIYIAQFNKVAPERVQEIGPYQGFTDAEMAAAIELQHGEPDAVFPEIEGAEKATMTVNAEKLNEVLEVKAEDEREAEAEPVRKKKERSADADPTDKRKAPAKKKKAKAEPAPLPDLEPMEEGVTLTTYTYLVAAKLDADGREEYRTYRPAADGESTEGGFEHEGATWVPVKNREINRGTAGLLYPARTSKRVRGDDFVIDRFKSDVLTVRPRKKA